MRYQPSSIHGPEQLYEVLLPFLANHGPLPDPKIGEDGEKIEIRDITMSTNLNEQIELGNCGDFESIQRSGTCFFRIILSTLRYCCKRIGFSIKKVFFFLNRSSLFSSFCHFILIFFSFHTEKTTYVRNKNVSSFSSPI